MVQTIEGVQAAVGLPMIRITVDSLRFNRKADLVHLRLDLLSRNKSLEHRARVRLLHPRQLHNPHLQADSLITGHSHLRLLNRVDSPPIILRLVQVEEVVPVLEEEDKHEKSAIPFPAVLRGIADMGTK